MNFIYRSLALAGTVTFFSSHGFSATSFGARNEPPPTAATQPSLPATPAQTSAPSELTPPNVQGVEWFKVPYEKAENEVLSLFQRDLPQLEESVQDVAIYEVRTSGQLPVDYHRNFRTKLERVILTSKKIKLKQCANCEESRLYKNEAGEIRYEPFSTDIHRPAKIASELGVRHFIYGELTYTPEDLQLRVRMVQPSTGEVVWSHEYSTADVVKTREGFNDADPDGLGHGDSLSRVMMGEIAFTTVLSTGVNFFPTVDNGQGSQFTSMPAVDVFIGERYDRGRKFFGFQMGGAFNMGGVTDKGKPLPWLLRLGPKIGYVFNPYNMTTARYSIAGELGGIISSGLATAYLGVGPEMTMIHRFSVGLMPLYILPSTVTTSQILQQQDNGTFTSADSSGGKFGGFGLLVRASIHW